MLLVCMCVCVCVCVCVCLCHIQAQLAHVQAEADLKVPFADQLPSRQAQLAALKDTEEFDVLVVGGGATGAGCALDAVTRSKLTVNKSYQLQHSLMGCSRIYNCP